MAVKKVVAQVSSARPELISAEWDQKTAVPGDPLKLKVKCSAGPEFKPEDLNFVPYLRAAKSKAWSPIPGAVDKVEKTDDGFTAAMRAPKIDGGDLVFFAQIKKHPEVQVKSERLELRRRKAIELTSVDSHFLPGREKLTVRGKVPRWVKFIRAEVYSQGRTRRGLGAKPVHWEVLPVTAHQGLIYLWNGVSKNGVLKDKALTVFDAPYSVELIGAVEKSHLEPEVDEVAAVRSNSRPFHIEIAKIELYYAPKPEEKQLRRLEGTVPILPKGVAVPPPDPDQPGAALQGVAQEKLRLVAKLFLKSKFKTAGRRGVNRAVFAPELFGKSKPDVFWREFSAPAASASGTRTSPTAPIQLGGSKPASTDASDAKTKEGFQKADAAGFPGKVEAETERRWRSEANADKRWIGHAGADWQPKEGAQGPFTLAAAFPRYRVQRQSTRDVESVHKVARFKIKWLKTLPRILTASWGDEEPSVGRPIELFGKLKGLKPGTPVSLEVYSGKKKIESLAAKVSPSGGVIASWSGKYDASVTEVAAEPAPPKGAPAHGPFTFKVKALGMEATSPEVVLKDVVEFVIEDEDGQPLKHRRYKLHMPCGETVEGESDAQGRILCDKATAGLCDLEILED